MKKLVAILLCLSQPSWAVIALVQKKTGAATSATTCVVTLTSTGSGNLLVGGIGATSAATGVADNAGTVNTYTHDTTDDGSGAGIASSIWYKANSNSGGTSVTFSGLAAGTNGDCFVWEFSGATLASPIDVGNHLNSQTSANPESGAAVTPNNAGDVITSVFGTLGGAITGVNTPWTITAGTTHGQGGSYLIPGNTSAQTPTYTGDSAGNAACSSTVSFLPPATVGGFKKAMRIQIMDE